MYEIKFQPLEFDGARVHVAWTIEPATPLYRQTHFTLDFGDALDPRTLPLKLWWTVALLCIHSHWNLLRPCRVILPVTLPENEIEFWQRLLDTERATLEKRRGTTDFARRIEIVCDGAFLNPGVLPPPVERYATAFSAGKDSLLQAALLAEFTERPLLVNTHSPMPPFHDHTWRFRQRALDEIVKRRDVELVVVKSDLRSIWSHYEFPHTLGYQISVSEMTDCYLYCANLLAVAAARGIPFISLSAEHDGRQVSEYHGQVCQDFEVSYSPIAMDSLSHLFQQLFGITYASLILPLTHYQIMQLIRQRYADLADLQISCSEISADSQQHCSRCYKCFRIAITLLALGENPASVGIDLNAVMEFAKEYTPGWDIVSGNSIAYAAAQIDLESVRSYFPNTHWRERFRLGEPRAFQLLRQIQKRITPAAPAWTAQLRPQALDAIPSPLREKLLTMYASYWHEPDPNGFDSQIALVNRAVDWLTAPLTRA